MADAPEPPVRDPAPADVERRIVSVLFADLVGFTPLSERLDAEDVAAIQDAYFSATRDTIARYGGVVEKFIGDAVMAVFGAPLARDDDAERAVRAGLALIGAVEQLNARLGLEPGSLELRVGVNTGEVVHATSGADAGRVTGDTVNTAARLQAAARPGSVLLGELTALSGADAIEMGEPLPIELKGKAEPVRAREATGLRPHPSREEALGSLRAATLGRDAELARLHETIAMVGVERRAGRVVVIAPPGVGKSRLLAELATTTEAAVRRARVRPQATAPYETVAQLFDGSDSTQLEAGLLAAGTTPSRAAVVVAEVDRLRDPVGRHGAGSDLAAERDARFDAWLEALEALESPGAGPSLWLVEDVHWAGADLLAFLARAGAAPTRGGRLVVATARPSLLETAPDWPGADRIELAPLTAGVAVELVRALVGDALPDGLVDAVVDRADGTPLFIEELIRTWISVGTLVRAPGGNAWRLVVQPESVVLPPTVQAIYAAQLDDLPPAARLLARRGSVAGRRVPSEALGTLELGDGREGLETLLRRAFLAGPMHDDVTGEMYAYRHALLRDAGYASLARVERARLHLAMARWLEEVAGERVAIVAEAIAEHLASALDSLPALAGPTVPERSAIAEAAASWSERAATAALSLSAHEAARRLLERAIALTDPGATLDLARRRLALGQLLAASADLGAGIVEIEAALASFRQALPDAAASFAESAYALGRAFMQQTRFAEAIDATAAALAELDRTRLEEPAGRSRLMALHAWAVSATGRRDGVAGEANEAEALAATLSDPALELDVLEHVTDARDELGEPHPGAWERMWRLSHEVGRWHQAVIATRNRARDEADENPASALAGMGEAAELAAAHGLTEQLGWSKLLLSETRFVVGDWDAAIGDGMEAVALAERYAYFRLGFRTWMVLLPMLAARGEPSPLERYDAWWTDAVGHFPSVPSPYGALLGQAVRVWRAMAQREPLPEPDAAIAEAPVQFVNPHFQAAIDVVVEAWIANGRLDLARAYAGGPLDDDATPLIRASDALRRALVARAEGDPDAVRRHATEAAAAARRIGACWWEARALRMLGDPESDVLEKQLGIGR
ncbi:MAG TPA: adenylate/guanylate cyclase domain-containing protein [Candidatus Angelobacter sp.]|nr:adenylate/guanylate cyclase domain-containing protein [Candidatus Angelobacter sp.]